MKEFIDNWRVGDFTCDACGWTGKGAALDMGEFTKVGCDVMCPSCGKVMEWLEFPHTTELMANLDRMTPEHRAEVERFAVLHDEWHRRKLHSPDELPDIHAPFIVVFWDEDHDTREIVLRVGEREIFRMPGSYEYYDFFVESCRVLKAKYGEALLDVIPTPNSYLNLWGDRLSAPEICDKMRALIRHDTRFWAERGPHDFSGAKVKPPKDAWKRFDPHRSWEESPAGEEPPKEAP